MQYARGRTRRDAQKRSAHSGLGREKLPRARLECIDLLIADNERGRA